KYGKQIRHAERRGIPFVWFPGSAGAADPAGSADSVKDIRSGEQVEADPATWAPPEADLHPVVTALLGRARPPSVGYAAVGIAKSRQVDVAWATNRPAASVSRASPSAVRRPRCITVPTQVSSSAPTVTGRRYFTDRSTEV